MQIFLSDGESRRVCKAAPNDSIGDVLARWAPADLGESRLAMGGRPLNTSWTLGRCGVRPGSTLHLLARMRGGTGMGAAPSWGTGPGVVIPVFEAYQAARLDFATELAKLAAPVEQTHAGAGIPGGTYEVDGAEKVLGSLEGLDILAPQIVGLTTDLAPQVQQCAMIAIGRLCNLSDNLHGKLAQPALLIAAVKTVSSAGSPALLKAGLFLLQSSVTNSSDGARLAVEAGALACLCERLDDTDAGTKAAAVWCLGAIAAHDTALASSVTDCGVLPLLLTCIKEPSLPLRRIALSCFGSIGKHDLQMAELLQKEGAIDVAASLLAHRDPLLRRHSCRMLALCCQHHESCAQWISQESQKHLIAGLSGTDLDTCHFAATLLQSLARASRGMASILYDLGAVAPLVAHLSQCVRAGPKAGSPLSAAAALGHICDATPEAASSALDHDAISAISDLLGAHGKPLQQPPHICAVLCACLGALAAPEPKHTDLMVQVGLLPAMANATILAQSPPRAAALAVARGGLARVVEHCGSEAAHAIAAYPALVWLAETLPYPSAQEAPLASPPSADALYLSDLEGTTTVEDGGQYGEATVLSAVFKGLATTLQQQGLGEQRLNFVHRGTLAHVQAAQKGPASLKNALKMLNDVFPSQMVQAADHRYEQRLQDMIKA